MPIHTIGCCTYMSLVVQLVVGQFELVEAHHLPHPRLSRGWRVRVDVDSGRHGGVCVPGNHPLGAMIHVSARVEATRLLLDDANYIEKTRLEGRCCLKVIIFK